MSGYEYDVFISYRRRDPVEGWVRNHFAELLRKWLPGETKTGAAKIFCDSELPHGTRWPQALHDALSRSRTLLCVWTPGYFRQSAWCPAEWQTMRAREKRTGSKLIYPVVFQDGKHFPPEARETQSHDLKQWAFDDPQYRNDETYFGLVREVKKIVEELARMAEAAPTWQADWPVRTPEPSEAPSMTLPRLRETDG